MKMPSIPAESFLAFILVAVMPDIILRTEYNCEDRGRHSIADHVQKWFPKQEALVREINVTCLELLL